MNMKVGEVIEVEVERLDAHGSGVAQVQERELLIPGVFPGERASVRIEALARHSARAHGRLRELLRPHPDRRALPCPRHEHAPALPDRPKPACGGCPWMALEHHAQLEQLRRTLADEHGLELREPILSGSEFGYRWSSKRIVAGRSGRLRLGSRAGERIADMRGCLVDHPHLRTAFDGVEQIANELGIEVWRQDRGTGDLRYVWGKTNGAQVLLTLITGSHSSRAATELAPLLHARGFADGVSASVQDDPGNAIRGASATTIVGLERLSIELAGVTVELGPLGFLQPNPIVAAMAYRDLVGPPPGVDSPVPRGSLAFDLYAGAGVTTQLLRERFDEVVACESYPESAAALGIAAQSAEAFCQAWLDARRPTPELILANPPRAGLGADVCASLLELGAPRVQIMSCSPKTLAEDLRRLDARYQLVGLRGYATLPQTNHVELVAWLVLR
jgi:23S rRNA (uracil1939-C5)-methyltransferase